MKNLKTCKKCNRFYRGEGYQDVCTEDCFFKKLSKSLHKKKVSKKTSIEKVNKDWEERDSEILKKQQLIRKRKKQAYIESYEC